MGKDSYPMVSTRECHALMILFKHSAMSMCLLCSKFWTVEGIMQLERFERTSGGHLVQPSSVHAGPRGVSCP